jgi:prepilin-type N-terminal cleavage/methylation domain-containing protein
MSRSSLKNGFTLIELLVAVGILSFTLIGLLGLFVHCIILNDNNRVKSLALSAAQTQMELIKDSSFDNLDSLNGVTFNLQGFAVGQGVGRITVTNESSTLKRVRIVACFMSRNRLIGDSLATCQTSPVELVTLIAR